MRTKVCLMVLVGGLLLALAGGGVAQLVEPTAPTLSAETQTPSATLGMVISLVEANSSLAETHVQVLTALFTAAIEQGILTPDQGLGLLEAVGWSELEEETELGFAVRALELALIAIMAEGAAYDEVLSTLVEMAESGELGPHASGAHAANALPGLITALLSTLELTPSLLAELEAAILAGVAPGQALRLVKTLIQTGAEEENILAALAELVEQRPGAGEEEIGPQEPARGRGRGEEPGPPHHPGKPSEDEDDDEEEEEGRGRGRGRGKKG